MAFQSHKNEWGLLERRVAPKDALVRDGWSKYSVLGIHVASDKPLLRGGFPSSSSTAECAIAAAKYIYYAWSNSW
jgi:hypothetical protein